MFFLLLLSWFASEKLIADEAVVKEVAKEQATHTTGIFVRSTILFAVKSNTEVQGRSIGRKFKLHGK